ncbi:FAD-dependent monooxygenase [Dactylosporangium siamense]|uniref:FAD-dependent oxidoreductase n=1 Tax=Dactylosporangium siamense TaxID=685454 RepID=A0A919U9P6_9ACTN|nr:FAD-dependent monooxygenase [Dactylosporangium siamense]GIG47127.1 FAD-dependent oxidoreductase [Dactylosporangium siamense]
MPSVLISGAGVAGFVLAHWLGRAGYDTTVVEIAPTLRTGGNAVDFRGPLHRSILERMGILADLQRVRTGGTAMRFVDEHGRRLMELPADFAGGDLEVLRGDLARVLHEHARATAEFRFGDSVTALVETPDGVDVTFAGGTHRRFDLVVGADGVHSGVRRLVFGPESRYVRHLGYYVATWSVPNDLGLRDRTSLLYNVPGRMASVGGDHRDPARAGAFLAFASPPLEFDRRDAEAQKAILRDRFAGVGWQVPRLLAALDDTPDLYFDAICRVDITPWSRGRVVLVGDAACGATIGGMGTGTGLVAAYTLAGELVAAGGDHTVAFPRYERLLHDYARRTQKGGDTTGRFLAPRRAWAARTRNWMLNRPAVMALQLKLADDRATDLALPDYALAG